MEEQRSFVDTTAGYAAAFVAGLAVGSLAAGAVMLFMAPMSGKSLRGEVRKRGLGLRDQAYENAKDFQDNARGLLSRGRSRSKKLTSQAEDLRDEALDRLSDWQELGQRMLKRQRKNNRGLVGAGRRMIDRMLG